MVACHIKDISHYDTGVRDLGAAPKYVYQWFKDRKLVPRDPAGFGARTRVTEKNEDAEVPMLPIRVLIVDRNDTRKIVNHEELVQQCQEDPGPWDCRGYSFGSGFIKCDPLRNLALRHRSCCASCSPSSSPWLL